MNALTSFVRLAPITANLPLRNPKILLCGQHQPALFRYLDHWSRRGGGSSAFLVQFAEDEKTLSHFATDSFDFAVVVSPSAESVTQVIKQLVRISRQGLITRR